MYDYREAMTEDVKEWIKENIDLAEWTEDREGLEQQLKDDLWTEDSILIIVTLTRQRKA